MNVLYPKALTLLRVVALSFILPSILLLAAYVLNARRTEAPIEPWRCFKLGTPLLLGVIILVKSQSWARRLTQDFDE